MAGRQAQKQYFEEYIFKPTTAQLQTVGPTTFQMFSIPAGYRVVQVDCRVLVGFDGTAPAINVGDGDDTDGFITAAGTTEATPGIYPGTGAYHAANAFGKLYTAADTVDLAFTGSANATVGEAKFVAVYHRVF